MNTMGSYIAGAVIVILMAVSIFLVSNTVSVGVAVREEEIAIMKLIGAANGFIKAPFRAEGIIIGVIGSLIPTAVIFAGYEGIISWMNDKFHVVTVFMEVCTDSGNYDILITIIFNSWDCDRVAWKFYYDPKVFKKSRKVRL